VKSQEYVFIQLPGGIERFRTLAKKDGSINFEESLLMLTNVCALLHALPDDFMVVRQELFKETKLLVQRAREVLAKTEKFLLRPRLTPREQQVLSYVLLGKANKEIADQVNLSVRTVKFHVSSLLLKYGVRGRGELAAVHEMNKDLLTIVREQ
jgi:DNA-binding NarL/FixJ family response regulator